MAATDALDVQTGGRILADRALSRLLKEDGPRTLELEGTGPSEARLELP